MMARLPRRLRALLAPAVVFVLGSTTMACAAADVPADWVEISAGGHFVLRAPPGSRLEPGASEDSRVGVIEVPGARLHFDHGAYSDPLRRDRRDQDYRTRDVQLDSRAARIVTAHAPQRSPARPYLIGVHFPAVGHSALGPIKLTVSAFVKAPEDYRLVERVLSTLRFPSAKEPARDR